MAELTFPQKLLPPCPRVLRIISTSTFLILSPPSCTSTTGQKIPAIDHPPASAAVASGETGAVEVAPVRVTRSAPKSKSKQKAPSLAGTYTTRTGGPGWLEITFERSSKGWSCSFHAGGSDGLGAAPDGWGTGKVKADGSLHFTFEDSFYNQGTGILRHAAGGGYELVMTVTKVADPRCLRLYGDVLPMRKTAG